MACSQHGFDVILDAHRQRPRILVGVVKPVVLPAINLQATASKAPAYGAPDDFTGPMTPAQLAQLDRKLTPAEQAAVEKGQSAEAQQQLDVERTKGGPRSSTVEVTEKGAIIKAEAPTRWWVLAVAGGAVVLVGSVLAITLRRKK